MLGSNASKAMWCNVCVFWGPERVFPGICLPKILANFGWTFWREFLPKPLILCVEGPNCSENSWEVFGWFFAIERLFRSPIFGSWVTLVLCFLRQIWSFFRLVFCLGCKRHHVPANWEYLVFVGLLWFLVCFAHGPALKISLLSSLLVVCCCYSSCSCHWLCNCSFLCYCCFLFSVCVSVLIAGVVYLLLLVRFSLTEYCSACFAVYAAFVLLTSQCIAFVVFFSCVAVFVYLETCILHFKSVFFLQLQSSNFNYHLCF